MYYGVTCWHAPEEDSQTPKTNFPIDFNREALGSFMVKIPNSCCSAVSRLGITFIFHIYWHDFLGIGKFYVIILGQLLFFPVAFTWPAYLPCQALCTIKTHVSTAFWCCSVSCSDGEHPVGLAWGLIRQDNTGGLMLRCLITLLLPYITPQAIDLQMESQE